MSIPNDHKMTALLTSDHNIYMSEFVQQYVATAAQGFSSGAGWLLADSLPFDPSHSWFMPLHQALQQVCRATRVDICIPTNRRSTSPPSLLSHYK